MRKVFILMALLAATVFTVAAGPRKGSVHAAAGTSAVERNFRGSVANLTIYAHSADVQVLHYPHYVEQDTFVVRVGDSFTWDNLDIYGFKVIRATSTAFDAWWW